jgi:hypothetical protein
VDEMSKGEMPVDEMSVDEMSVDEMSVDEMTVEIASKNLALQLQKPDDRDPEASSASDEGRQLQQPGTAQGFGDEGHQGLARDPHVQQQVHGRQR